MKAIIQRVKNASVEVDGNIVGKIRQGLLIFLGVASNDDEKDAQVLSAKISNLRIFSDENDKMNLSLKDISGEALVVSNFTLCGDCRHGRRPFFGDAAQPDLANSLYEYFCTCFGNNDIKKIEKGIFGADMQVSLINDGPVTMQINSEELKK